LKNAAKKQLFQIKKTPSTLKIRKSVEVQYWFSSCFILTNS